MTVWSLRNPHPRRVPQGTCGLKWRRAPRRRPIRMSGPARDLWIEIFLRRPASPSSSSGPARDLWIEILSLLIDGWDGTGRRVPQGTCGLKFFYGLIIPLIGWSGPARDLWIEIRRRLQRRAMRRSGPARDLWIEIIRVGNPICRPHRSGPARDLWIEISSGRALPCRSQVGSRKGPVD